jgi:hypothetical protein
MGWCVRTDRIRGIWQCNIPRQAKTPGINTKHILFNTENDPFVLLKRGLLGFVGRPAGSPRPAPSSNPSCPTKAMG